MDSIIITVILSYASKHMGKRPNSQHPCYPQILTFKICLISFAGFKIPDAAR